MPHQEFRTTMTPREFIAATYAEQAEIDAATVDVAERHRTIARYRLDQDTHMEGTEE